MVLRPYTGTNQLYGYDIWSTVVLYVNRNALYGNDESHLYNNLRFGKFGLTHCKNLEKMCKVIASGAWGGHCFKTIRCHKLTKKIRFCKFCHLKWPKGCGDHCCNPPLPTFKASHGAGDHYYVSVKTKIRNPHNDFQTLGRMR